MISTCVSFRPENEDERLPKEIACYDLLDRLGIAFRRVDHSPAMTMEDCARIDEVLGTVMCKNLLLCNRQKTDFYLLLLPGNKQFRTAEVSRKLGSSRLSFASGEDMERLLGITPGALTLLGLMNDKEKKVRLLVDRVLLNEEQIGMHPCVNTSSISLATKDAFGPLLSATEHDMTLLDLD